MSEVRIHNLAISLDGFATGDGQALETPFGHAGERLHEWMFATRFWNEMGGNPGGSEGADHAFAVRHSQGFGAEIMGANKFGPPGWQDDADWKGWWGPEPAVPLADVRAHPPAAPTDRDGGRHHLPLPRRQPAEVLEQARAAAGGLDVRIGGGPTVVRDFVAAGLVDHMHLVQVPMVLGRGVRVWDGLEALEETFDIEVTSTRAA